MKNAPNQKREEFDFVKKRKKYTDRYARHITEQVVNSDLKSVAKRNNLTESEVESMINQISQMILPINIKNKILHQELNKERIEQKKTAESLEIKQRENIFSTADQPGFEIQVASGGAFRTKKNLQSSDDFFLGEKDNTDVPKISPKKNEATHEGENYKPGDRVYWKKSPQITVNAVIKRVWKQKIRIITTDFEEININIADIVGKQLEIDLSPSQWSDWTWKDNQLVRVNRSDWSQVEVCSDRKVLEDEIASLKSLRDDYLNKANNKTKARCKELLAAVKDKDQQIQWCEHRLKIFLGENSAKSSALEIFLGENNAKSSALEISPKKKCVDCASCDPCGNTDHYFCLTLGKYFGKDAKGCEQFIPN